MKRVFPHLFLLCLLAARSASAHPAWGIVVDPRGRIVFSEVTTNSVWRVEEDGGLVRLVTGRHSHDLFQDERGALLLALAVLALRLLRRTPRTERPVLCTAGGEVRAKKE